MHQLPAELLESIAYLLKDDYYPLKNCSLVSRRWTPIFQHILFTEIVISCSDPGEYPTRFLDVIARSPWLGRYVKKLEFRRIDLAPKDVPETIMELTELVQELTLHGEDLEMTDVGAHEGVFRSSQITTLILKHAREFPFHLLGLCASLTHLTIEDTTFSQNSTILPGLGSTRSGLTRLRHLRISPLNVDMRGFVEWLRHPSCGFDLRELQSFSTQVDDIRDQELLCKLLPFFAPSLEKLFIEPALTLGGYLEPEETIEPLNPAQFVNLHSLTIGIEQDRRINAGITNTLNFIPWLIAFLSALPNPQQLEELIIPCTFIGNRACDEIPLQGWKALAVVLCNPKFTRLKRVCVAFYRHSTTSHRFSFIASLLRSSLDGLHKKGILEIRKSAVRGQP